MAKKDDYLINCNTQKREEQIWLFTSCQAVISIHEFAFKEIVYFVIQLLYDIQTFSLQLPHKELERISKSGDFKKLASFRWNQTFAYLNPNPVH